MAKSHFQAAFLPDPQRVSELRHDTAAFLRRSGVAKSRADDAVLAVSELVTNAIRHGGGEVGLRVSVSGGRLRIAVTDENPEPAKVQLAAEHALSGRGLFLVAAFADCWGSSGKETWCEFRYLLDGVREATA